MKIDIKTLPTELIQNRDSIECNFIFSLWKEPFLADEYLTKLVNGEDIITKDGILYFHILKNVLKTGAVDVDDMAVLTFLQNQPKINQRFEERGGFNSVHEILEVVNPDNLDSYYDALCKNNLMINLYNKGFPVMQHFEKLDDATAEEVYDFFDFELANTAIGKIEKTQIDTLSDGYEDAIEKWDSGTGIGFRIGSGMLNYNLDGLHTGNIILHEAFIGEGKTTTAILLYVLPAIVDGNNVLICANEQNIDQFRQMILTSVLFNYCSNHAGLNRKKIRQGNYTPEQKKALREAAEWLKRQPGKIQFATLQDYNIQAIRRVVTKMSRMSYQVILIDTLKPEDDASDRAWAFFIEMSKKIFLLAKKTNTAIVATCQLSPESKQKYYLDLSCTGKAKGIAEIAEAVVMFRHISKGEYDSIHPWKWDKEKKMKTELVLDDNKHYIMIFMPKTRSGSTTLQIICEFNQDFLTLKDVGWWEQSYNVTKRRN